MDYAGGILRLRVPPAGSRKDNIYDHPPGSDYITTQGLEPEMTEVYRAIYHKLEVIGVLSVSEYDVIKNDPLTPLYIDRLAPDRYAIARNRVVDGIMVPDPDMEIRVDHERKLAEPLTYQDQKCRKVVYPEPGSVNLTIKNELVTYLDRWLTGMINDGYRRN